MVCEYSKLIKRIILIVVFLTAGLLLLGCRGSKDDLQATPVSDQSALPVAVTSPENGGESNIGLPNATSTLEDQSPISNELTPSFEPSLEPCTKPEEWVVHNIRPGDTLFGMSQATGTDVETLQRVNCLGGNLIIAGETIYLPQPMPVQPVTPTAAAPVIPIETMPPGVTPTLRPTVPPPCTGDLCEEIGDTITLGSGGPGEDDSPFVPCKDEIEPGFDSNPSSITEIGERISLYLCGFTATELTLIDPDSIMTSISVKPYIPIPSTDPPTSSVPFAVTGMIDFIVLPNMSKGIYEIQAGGEIRSFRLKVDQYPNTPRIIISPPGGTVGDTFELYFFNFDPNLPPVYYTYRSLGTVDHQFLKLAEREVVVETYTNEDGDVKGWAKATLSSSTVNPEGIYAVSGLEIMNPGFFWLVQMEE